MASFQLTQPHGEREPTIVSRQKILQETSHAKQVDVLPSKNQVL